MVKCKLCSRRCSEVTRDRRATQVCAVKRHICAAATTNPWAIRGPRGLEAAWWTGVNLLVVRCCDRARDPGDSVSPMPFAPLPGSRRTTKVKRELYAEVPQAVAQEPPRTKRTASGCVVMVLLLCMANPCLCCIGPGVAGVGERGCHVA
jgi:hypothetical protein